MTNPHDLIWALNTAKRLGAKEEQERIIQLIENISQYHRISLIVRGEYKDGLVLEEVLAIIKGEREEVK